MATSLLQPHTKHEEKEQLRMATKLSLVTQEPSEPSEPSEPCSLEPITDGITNKSTSDFTSDPDEAASILLSLNNNINDSVMSNPEPSLMSAC